MGGDRGRFTQPLFLDRRRRDALRGAQPRPTTERGDDERRLRVPATELARGPARVGLAIVRGIDGRACRASAPRRTGDARQRREPGLPRTLGARNLQVLRYFRRGAISGLLGWGPALPARASEVSDQRELLPVLARAVTLRIQMKRFIAVMAVMLMTAVSATAELRRAEIKIFGMD